MNDQPANTEQNDDDYDAAFDEFAGETTAAHEPSAEAEDGSDAGAAPEPVEAESSEVDGAPEGADEDPVAAAKREAEQWRHKYQSDQGRQAALQRKIEEQQAQLAQIQQSRQNNRPINDPEPEAPEGSGMSDAEWGALQEDFPEMARAIEARLSKISQYYESRLSQVESRLQPLQAQQEQAAIQSEYSALESKHPDWRDIAQSQEFHDWARQQPEKVQELRESWSAADVSFLLDTFKRTQAPAQTTQPGADLQARRQRQLQQGRSVSGRSSRSTSGLPAADDFEASFNHWAENS